MVPGLCGPCAEVEPYGLCSENTLFHGLKKKYFYLNQTWFITEVVKFMVSGSMVIVPGWGLIHL